MWISLSLDCFHLHPWYDGTSLKRTICHI